MKVNEFKRLKVGDRIRRGPRGGIWRVDYRSCPGRAGDPLIVGLVSCYRVGHNVGCTVHVGTADDYFIQECSRA